MKLPVVAIIGRPNVGKSTLFNCFAKQQKAIVSDIPGTTRDSLMEKVEGDTFDYFLVDTAGLHNAKGDSLDQEIQMQVEVTLKNADAILFLVDGKASITLEDEEIILKLRKATKPLIFVANKIDDGQTHGIFEFSRFGFGVPLAISAKNFTGMWELEDAIENALRACGASERSKIEEADQEQKASTDMKVVFIGRPNVGKSSLFNALLGENRSVVSDIPGTTRDSIDSDFIDTEGQKFIFLDTAGLKRPGKIGRDIDFWSSVRTHRSIAEADIGVLLLDALDGVMHQDLALAGQILEEKKGIVIVVNKFDLVREKTKGLSSDDRELEDVKMDKDANQARKNYLSYLLRKMPFLPSAPVIFLSAKTKRGLSELLPSIKSVFVETRRRIPTSELNKFIEEVYHGHVTPMRGTMKGSIKYVSQVDIAPPKFLFFVKNKKAFHFSYYRYLENKIRERYGFFGVPFVVEFRDGKEGDEFRK